MLGYKIYLNDILNTVLESNILSYSFTTYISPSISNSISVSEYSIIGEIKLQ